MTRLGSEGKESDLCDNISSFLSTHGDSSPQLGVPWRLTPDVVFDLLISIAAHPRHQKTGASWSPPKEGGEELGGYSWKFGDLSSDIIGEGLCKGRSRRWIVDQVKEVVRMSGSA